MSYTYLQERPQASHICQVAWFIWGTVREHPVPVQAVSLSKCLLISPAIRLGQWWMVCVSPALAWLVLWYSLTTSSSCTSRLVKGLAKWHPLYITLAVTLDYLDSSWHDESLGLIYLFLHMSPVSVLYPSLSELFILKTRSLITVLPDGHTFYLLLFKESACFRAHKERSGWGWAHEYIRVTTDGQEK